MKHITFNNMKKDNNKKFQKRKKKKKAYLKKAFKDDIDHINQYLIRYGYISNPLFFQEMLVA